MRIDRKPSGALLIQGAASAVALSAAVALGVGLGFRLDDPATITKYRTLDLPPACTEIDAAVQHERALTEQLDEAAGLVDEISADLPDVVLSSDTKAIVERASQLDDAKRDAQALELDVATAQATTSAVVGDCAPERDR